MSVAKMQKVRILFHQSLKEAVLEELQRLGALHISSLREKLPQLPDGVSMSGKDLSAEMEANLAGVQFARKYLQPFEEKKGALEKLSTPRVELSRREYQQLVAEFDGQEVIGACRQLERDRARLNGELAENHALQGQMNAWIDLDAPLEDLRSTANSALLAGTVPTGKFPALSDRLEELAEAVHLERTGSAGAEENCLLIYHQSEHDHVMQVLEEVNFTERKFPGLKGTPRQVSRRLEKEIAAVKRSLQQVEEHSRKLAEHQPKLMVLEEHLADQVDRAQAEARMASTARVCVLEGWLRKKDFRPLQGRLEGQFGPLSMMAIDPQPDETPPIELVNKPVPASFEMVIDLYGRPKYHELDPTPFLAPFFAVFFGLCLTDAGYGLTLSILSFLLLKKGRLGPGMRKLFRLLLWSGLATIVAGVLTGGYFGIDWSQFDPQSPLVRAVYAVKLFDPIENALVFFKLAIAMGVSHIFVGLALKMYMGIRQGAVISAVLKQGPWLLADVGVGIFMMNFLSPVGQVLSKVGTYCLATGLVGIFLFNGIGTKNPIVWVGRGLGGVYGVIGIFGDILSYSRLVALGLATAVIAGVINILGAMVMKIPFIGIILAILLFILAHLAYMAISCLGAFVHTARLNFVEFFSKFYEGGGEPFRPLHKRGHYVRWSDEEKSLMSPSS